MQRTGSWEKVSDVALAKASLWDIVKKMFNDEGVSSEMRHYPFITGIACGCIVIAVAITRGILDETIQGPGSAAC
jgi:hypothetical protein